MANKKIILASTSPRRQELMSRLKIDFEIVDSGYDEDMSLKKTPITLAKFLSLGKAKAVADRYKNSIIIAADTFVAFENKVMGKPHTAEVATKMLRSLSGKTAQIITGLAIIDTTTNKCFSEVEVGKVKFKKLSKSEIENYIKSGECLDRAGAFEVQGLGGVMIEKISGDFNSIVGLPLFKVAKILTKLGVKIL